MRKKSEIRSKDSIDRGVLKNLKSTYKYARSGRKYLYLFLFTQVIFTILAVVIPIITARRLVLLTSGVFDKLFVIFIIIFIMEISRNLVRYIGSYAYNKFYYDVRRNLQIELTRETLKITQEELNTTSSGVFIERINNDTDSLTDVFASLINQVTTIIGNFGILVTIFFINRYMFLAYLSFIIIIIAFNRYSSNINYMNRKKLKKEREKTGGFISEIVRGSKDVKILNAEESFLKKADQHLKKASDMSYKYHMERSKYRAFSGTIRDTADLGIGILICVSLISKILGIESALIIYSYHYQILYTADIIENIYEILKQFNLSANRIFGVLEEKEFNKEVFGNKKLKNFNGNIEFKNVSFSYEDNIPVLKNLSFKIDANQTVGFVGPSGAGKSTIFNLISAINKVDSGEILFDGINISELDKESIRGNLSVISQNAYIFNMSIMENLKIVKSNATNKEVKEACRLACLDDFIESLPNKYNTIVGEGGVTLSGGQRQRLAIARALLLKTEILLFDEATSALDNKTQSKIQEAISNLKGEYTILIIAHRLSTVINADKIFVIVDGAVEEEGTHSYLIKNSKTYNKLYDKERKKEKV